MDTSPLLLIVTVLLAVVGWMLRSYHARLERHMKRCHELAGQLTHVWVVVRALWRDRYGPKSEPPDFPEDKE